MLHEHGCRKAARGLKGCTLEWGCVGWDRGLVLMCGGEMGIVAVA